MYSHYDVLETCGKVKRGIPGWVVGRWPDSTSVLSVPAGRSTGLECEKECSR